MQLFFVFCSGLEPWTDYWIRMRAVGKSQVNSTALLLSEPTPVIKFTTKQQGTPIYKWNFMSPKAPILMQQNLSMDKMFRGIGVKMSFWKRNCGKILNTQMTCCY